MKQLAQYQDGRLELQEVPEPSLMPGGILVRTTCSVISPGTERMKVEQAKMSLLEKARARPDQVRKVLDTARTLGWKAAVEKVRNRLESPTPLGYSAAGVVVAVDALNTRFRVGDRAARTVRITPRCSRCPICSPRKCRRAWKTGRRPTQHWLPSQCRACGRRRRRSASVCW